MPVLAPCAARTCAGTASGGPPVSPAPIEPTARRVARPDAPGRPGHGRLPSARAGSPTRSTPSSSWLRWRPATRVAAATQSSLALLLPGLLGVRGGASGSGRGGPHRCDGRQRGHGYPHPVGDHRPARAGRSRSWSASWWSASGRSRAWSASGWSSRSGAWDRSAGAARLARQGRRDVVLRATRSDDRPGARQRRGTSVAWARGGRPPPVDAGVPSCSPSAVPGPGLPTATDPTPVRRCVPRTDLPAAHAPTVTRRCPSSRPCRIAPPAHAREVPPIAVAGDRHPGGASPSAHPDLLADRARDLDGLPPVRPVDPDLGVPEHTRCAGRADRSVATGLHLRFDTGEAARRDGRRAGRDAARPGAGRRTTWWRSTTRSGRSRRCTWRSAWRRRRGSGSWTAARPTARSSSVRTAGRGAGWRVPGPWSSRVDRPVRPAIGAGHAAVARWRRDRSDWLC